MRKDNLKEKIIEILKEVKLGKNMNVVLLIDDYLIMKADQILELFEKEEDDTIDGLLLANEGLQMQVNALLKEQPPEEWEKEGETDIDVLYVKRAKNDANCDSFINIPKVIIRQLLQEEKKKWAEEKKDKHYCPVCGADHTSLSQFKN